MPTVSEILSAIAPELDDVDAGVRQVHVDLAEMQTGKAFRDARNHAVALLAAHTMTVSSREGQSGGVSNISEGSLSIGFGRVNPMGTDQLETTSYGAELIRLRRSYIMSARTVLV